MSEENEPYECMNEGPDHATADYLATLLASAALVLGLVALMWSNESGAAESWAAQWVSGYETGYCWTRNPCDYIPPVQIPYPEDGQTDGYIAGLKAGLEDGKEDI